MSVSNSFRVVLTTEAVKQGVKEDLETQMPKKQDIAFCSLESLGFSQAEHKGTEKKTGIITLILAFIKNQLLWFDLFGLSKGLLKVEREYKVEKTLVRWGQYKVVKLRDGVNEKLHTKLASSCLLIWLVGRKCNAKDKISHIGLVHLMNLKDFFMVKQAVEEMKGSGENDIEAYIAGGMQEVELSRMMNGKTVALLDNEDKVSLKKNLFGLFYSEFYVETPGLFYKNKSYPYVEGSRGISEAGFDAQCRPYIIQDVLLPDYYLNWRKAKAINIES